MNDIAEQYHNIYHEATLEETKASFRLISDNIIQDSNKMMSVIFIRISDATFQTIKDNPAILGDKDFMSRCYFQTGDNIHLVKAFGKGYQGFRQILLKLIDIYDPKTITWFRDDFNKLHSISTKRSILCLG